MSYSRKYYLIRKLKAEGYELKKAENERVILIPLSKVHEADRSKVIKELMQQHGYGAQIVNSLTEPEKPITGSELTKLCSTPAQRKNSRLAIMIIKAANRIIAALEKKD
jgi:hypothetical protein